MISKSQEWPVAESHSEYSCVLVWYYSKPVCLWQVKLFYSTCLWQKQTKLVFRSKGYFDRQWSKLRYDVIILFVVLHKHLSLSCWETAWSLIPVRACKEVTLARGHLDDKRWEFVRSICFSRGKATLLI